MLLLYMSADLPNVFRKQVLGQDHPLTKESEDMLSRFSRWRMEGLYLGSLGKDVNSTVG